MSEHAGQPTPAGDATAGTTPVRAAAWVAQLVVAGIFVMGLIPKFTGQADALADKLPLGWTSVYAIGVVEALTVLLILIPKTAVFGAIAAAMVMLGAIASHFTVVGFADPFGTMFVLAIVAFAAAVVTVILRRDQLPKQP